MYQKEVKKLSFNKDGKFKILMISDMHSSGNFHGIGRAYYRDKMLMGMEALLDEVKPDFVMLGGDQCFGNFENMSDNLQENLKLLYDDMKEVLSPILTRGLPWAHVYGNHDAECKLTKAEMEPVYESFDTCVSKAGPENLYGVGNYLIPVYSGTDENKVAYNIFCLDSNRELKDELKLFGVEGKEDNAVLPFPFGMGKGQSMPLFSQVMWYYNTSLNMEMKEGRKTPAIMCMHNPILEHNLIYRNPEETNMIGSKRESPACSELNSGLFYACLERGDVKGIFCGHEHLNTYQGTYCGITLAYDGCIGFDMSAHDDLRGGRVIELDEKESSFTTKFIPLVELLGKKAWRREEFEGGWHTEYFIRNTHL